MSFKPVQRSQGGLWLIHPSGGYQDQLVRYYELDLVVSWTDTPTMRKCYESNIVDTWIQDVTFPDGKCLGVDLTKHHVDAWIEASTTNMSATDLIGKLQLACDCQSGNGASIQLVAKMYDQCDELITSGTLASVYGSASGNPDLPTARGALSSIGIAAAGDGPTYIKRIGLYIRKSSYHGGSISVDGKLMFQGIW